jgi:hypothetical protein
MEHVVAAEYQRRSPAARRIWLIGGFLFIVALLIGAPGLLSGWLPGALFGSVPLIGAALALYSLPGLALLRWFGPSDLPLAERAGLALSLSPAVPPLLLLFSAPVGVHWGALPAWGVLALCALLAVWPRAGRPWVRRPALALSPHNGALLAITLAALLTRLYTARDLVAGQFGDSYHHTMIAQLFVDHGGLFRSWLPYAPLDTFTYHFGFHGMAAWLHWLSGVPVTQSVVLTGQIMSALAAPLLYVFTLHLFGSQRAALGAAFAVGLLSLFPAYYVNWGRYTQLAGQMVLPAACVAWMLLLDRAVTLDVRPQALVRPLVLAIIATAGTALNHYRIGAFVALFVLVYAGYLLIVRVRSPLALVRLSSCGALAGLGAVLLTLPWLLRIREGALLRLAGYYLSTSTDISNGYSAPDMARALANGMGLLALLGLVALLLARNWRALILVAWAGSAWLAANPHLLGLNGSGLLSNFAVVVAAYLVLAPLAGAGIAALFTWIARMPQTRPALAATLPIALAALFLTMGVWIQARIVDPSFGLYTAADEQAAAWIRAETPPDATFFVNSFPAFGATVYAGSDGGWWLALMAGRRTNLEPMALGFEAAATTGYYQTVLERNRAVLAHPVDSAEAAAALRAWGYSYLYDGPAANPPGEYLDPARLNASPLYEQVYSRDGVTIWRVR